jgi:hypothetical protein
VSPAEEIRAAVTKLRGPDAHWIEFVHPALALHLAALLDATAAEISRIAGDLTEAALTKYDPMALTWLPALAVARLINDTFPSSS